MYCTNCGKKYEGDTCPACGAKAGYGPKAKTSAAEPAAATESDHAAEQNNTSDTGLHCPKCGAAMSYNAEFCDKCGASTIPGINKKYKCTYCGAVFNEKPKYCPQCGRAFDASKAAQSIPVCPLCGGKVNYQVFSEKERVGCFFTILVMILLALFFYIFVSWITALIVAVVAVIILTIINRRTVYKTYAICERCGHKTLVNTSTE